MKRSLTVLILIFATGCVTGQTKKSSTLIVDEFALDPTLIKASVESGEVKKSEVINSTDVFAAAQLAFKKRQYEKAIGHYGIIIEHFHDSAFSLAALYNTGLAFDFLRRHEEAADAYRRVVEKFPARSEATDALFRLVGSLGKLKRHGEVMKVIEKIFDRTGLQVGDHVEAHTRLGDAQLAMGQLSKAEASYREALKINRRAHVDDALPEDAYFIAAAKYGVGQVYHQIFLTIKFKLPVERMEQDLKDKIKLFDQTQSLYIRTIRLGHPYWTTASRYQIARMYEEFYADLLASEIPKLTDEEAQIYFEELRAKLRPLMDRALQYYEKTITLSERRGVDNEYTAETQAALERLKAYLTNPNHFDSDEARVRSGQALETLGAPPTQDDHGEPLRSAE